MKIKLDEGPLMPTRADDIGRKCVNCGHNIRTGPPASIECHCDIDGHYISYLSNFSHWCRRWKKDHTFDKKEESKCE